jgi:DNA-binding NtrC family response regulator
MRSDRRNIPHGSGSGSRARWTVLLVDQDPSVVRGLAEQLRRRGYEVLTASSGNAAFRIAGSRDIDAAVIEYRIPDWRGDVLLEAIAAHQPHLAGRTVFMTGGIRDDVGEISSRTGRPVLMKPFDIEPLEWHLMRFLHGGEARAR